MGYHPGTRTLEEARESIQHTHCFGVYLDNKQIGFARVLTDQVAFAYLMDVFILAPHRGRGYAIQLLQTILDHPLFSKVSRWVLITDDAHLLYEKVGFQPLPRPERFMQLLKNN